MLRKYGWFEKGKPFMRSNFQRRLRHSFLGFCGVTGLLSVARTEGTFDRQVFFNCMRQFVLSGKVQPYPGKHSVWIMDGAAIHCDEHIVHYLRSVGIYVLFNAAYCPFFNPIEFLFGFIKSDLQKYYEEIPGTELNIIMDAFCRYECFDMKKVFLTCGFDELGRFDPCKNLEKL